MLGRVGNAVRRARGQHRLGRRRAGCPTSAPSGDGRAGRDGDHDQRAGAGRRGRRDRLQRRIRRRADRRSVAVPSRPRGRNTTRPRAARSTHVQTRARSSVAAAVLTERGERSPTLDARLDDARLAAVGRRIPGRSSCARSRTRCSQSTSPSSSGARAVGASEARPEARARRSAHAASRREVQLPRRRPSPRGDPVLDLQRRRRSSSSPAYAARPDLALVIPRGVLERMRQSRSPNQAIEHLSAPTRPVVGVPLTLDESARATTTIADQRAPSAIQSGRRALTPA